MTNDFINALNREFDRLKRKNSFKKIRWGLVWFPLKSKEKRETNGSNGRVWWFWVLVKEVAAIAN